MGSPQFPDVPNDPGVPPVNRDASNDSISGGSGNDVLGSNDDGGGDNLTANTLPGAWGIYDSSGNAVLVGDSFVSFDYANDWDVPAYPIENGGFQSYNKVQTPFDAKVTVSQGGTQADRTAFLAEANAIISDTNLYTVSMPEFSYPSVNMVHVDFARRSDKGVQLLLVAMYFKQIRQDAAAAFSNTQTPSGANTVNDGAVQPAAPSQTQAGAAIGGAS